MTRNAADLVVDAEVALLDFDGLIIDTEYAGWRSWNDIYELHGLRLSEAEWAHQCGRATLFEPWEPLEQVGLLLDRETLLAKHERRKHELLVLLPGVREFVSRLPKLGLRAGIVSNSPEFWIVGNLERHGLPADLFSVIVCGDALPAKPSPARYLAALDALNVAPARAIAVEDSAKGVAAAVAAGLRCVAVPSRITQHSDLSVADYRITSLDRLRLEPTSNTRP
jgi:HAD superfamily hydrolase (TIGR01509 family)